MTFEKLVGGRIGVIALIVACAFFMETLDANIIVTAMPTMAHSFGVAPTRMSIGVTAYVLAVAACIPASGWIADRFGARRVFCTAIGLFTLGSLLCGLAPSFWTFIAARVFQGSAAALMSPVGRLVVLRNAEKSDLMRALSTLVWPALIGPVVGPPLGGLIVTVASWRWIFFVNLPVGLLGMALVLAVIPKEGAARRQPFDLKGFLLVALTLTSLTIGVDTVAGKGANPPLAAVALVMAVGLGVFAYRHLSRAAQPLVSMASLKIQTFFTSCLGGGLVSRIGIAATPFLLPLMFQLGFGVSPVVSGSLLFFYMLANLGMKAITNPILKRWGIRTVLVANGLIASAGIAACALLTRDMSVLLSGAILAVAGASRSMQFTALTMMTFADVSAEERSSANVVSSLSQQVGGAMGVAAGAILLNVSQVFRGQPALELIDFRIALAVMGAVSALATIAYLRLPAHAGAEISGHTPQPRPVAA